MNARIHLPAGARSRFLAGTRSLAASCALAASFISCGSLDMGKDDAKKDAPGADTGSTAQVEKTKDSLNLSDIQLKSAALLVVHTENVFGPGMDLPVGGAKNNDDKSGVSKSVFKVYENNFGSSAGLKVGDAFGDAPTEAYFLGLAIAGDTIARNCQSDLLSKGESSKCNCKSESAAKALIGRAFVQWDFDTPERKAFIARFAKGCSENYTATINGMVSSLAYALRR